jgi:hypothetical protein
MKPKRCTVYLCKRILNKEIWFLCGAHIAQLLYCELCSQHLSMQLIARDNVNSDVFRHNTIHSHDGIDNADEFYEQIIE